MSREVQDYGQPEGIDGYFPVAPQAARAEGHVSLPFDVVHQFRSSVAVGVIEPVRANETEEHKL